VTTRSDPAPPGIPAIIDGSESIADVETRIGDGADDARFFGKPRAAAVANITVAEVAR
jgi:hypothetical protein